MPTQLSQVVSLPDVILLNHFDFIIPNPPGLTSLGYSRDLTIRNLTTSQRVMADFDPVKVVLHRHAVKYAGKGVVDGSITASYVDTSDKRITNVLEEWYLQIRDEETGLPKPKAGYKADAVMIIYDLNNTASIYRTYYNLWVSKVEPLSLSGNEDTPLEYRVTFEYDYFKLGSFLPGVGI